MKSSQLSCTHPTELLQQQSSMQLYIRTALVLCLRNTFSILPDKFFQVKYLLRCNTYLFHLRNMCPTIDIYIVIYALCTVTVQYACMAICCNYVASYAYLMNKLVKPIQKKKHCCVVVASKFEMLSKGSVERLESHASVQFESSCHPLQCKAQYKCSSSIQEFGRKGFIVEKDCHR